MFAHTSNHDLSTGERLPKVASEDLTCQSSLFHLLPCVGRQSKHGFMSSCLFEPIPQAKSRGCYPELSRALRDIARFQSCSPYVRVSFFLPPPYPLESFLKIRRCVEGEFVTFNCSLLARSNIYRTISNNIVLTVHYFPVKKKCNF